MSSSEVQRLAEAPMVTAPDTMTVHVLTRGRGESSAVFDLEPGETSRAGRHRGVREVWYFLAGRGEMWLQDTGDDAGRVEEVAPGTVVAFDAGVAFQVRNRGDDVLRAFGVTMPPWPLDRDDEWQSVAGRWPTD